ncbi:MAG TPA: CPBP family intramembrane glutamic endopeptidase [Kofleriaceae bacterium]|nr:CPBP family intramembrane glutamic endopeptidase [Kofleriaceae bacterium]
MYHAPLAIAGCAIATIYAVQIVLAGAGAPALVAAAASYVVAIAFVVVAARRDRALLGVRRARPRYFAGAILVGIALWFPMLVVVALIVPSPEVRPLEHLVTSAPAAPTLVVIALLPAICEELVFRGIAARALARRIHPALAVLATAAAFAIYHLQPAQMVATFVLGLALGFIAIRANSALPTMCAHAANNAIAIVLVRDPDASFWRWMTANPAIALAACIVVVVGGLVLAR